MCVCETLTHTHVYVRMRDTDLEPDKSRRTRTPHTHTHMCVCEYARRRPRCDDMQCMCVCERQTSNPIRAGVKSMESLRAMVAAPCIVTCAAPRGRCDDVHISQLHVCGVCVHVCGVCVHVCGACVCFKARVEAGEGLLPARMYVVCVYVKGRWGGVEFPAAWMWCL